MDNRSKLEVVKGDITRIEVDAIVNAANSTLLGGGGVDGAIHRAGGPAILAECRQIIADRGGCPTGEAVITTAGRLPAKFVIHTVGPVWNGGSQNEAQKLANCYLNSLKIAFANNCRSIAFPNISTGVYGFPKALAATVSIKTVNDYTLDNLMPEKIFFVCFDLENYELLRSELLQLAANHRH